ncbi:MAG: dihydroorotate dehydrogenase [Clostridia bacterium]|jgi:dihydroorotate dehydrogenase (NAD+) catalytic subunit|nr:dihydroorotate dehydrogenase [Clostridia bacterium]
MLTREICGVKFKNPVIAASGTFGFGKEYSEFYDVSLLGGICTKGLTLYPKEGNDGVRVVETRGGMLNSVGLQNPGIDNFILKELPYMEGLQTNIIANVGGNNIDQYIEAVEKLNNTPVHMIELNISCPNVKSGGMAFGIRCEDAYEVVSKVRAICKKPLIVKLSPNAEDIVAMAVKCREAGADALSLINTIKAMAIDIRKRRPVFENVTAGLSGPAIKPIALRMVYEVSRAVDIPVIGLGGIMTGQDAIEFIMAGATAIQVGTANFMQPDVGMSIIEEIREFMFKEGIKSIDEIVGVAAL